jgi:addiction module RelE/StbE family toxin
MDFEVIFTKPAVFDLQSIAEYVGVQNPDAAQKMGGEIIEKIEKLGQFPHFGRVVPEFREPNLRELIYRNYRIVYRVVDHLKQVHILRVWHAARGVPRLFK